MNLKELKKGIIKFRDDRDWRKYHNPKDLALSLCLESNEVLEMFQWKASMEDIKDVVENKKDKLGEEIADVFNYLVLLCEACDIDLMEVSEKKLKKNNEKYPIDKIKGNYRKYTEL